MFSSGFTSFICRATFAVVQRMPCRLNISVTNYLSAAALYMSWWEKHVETPTLTKRQCGCANSLLTYCSLLIIVESAKPRFSVCY
jgi:hypothetical protein